MIGYVYGSATWRLTGERRAQLQQSLSFLSKSRFHRVRARRWDVTVVRQWVPHHGAKHREVRHRNGQLLNADDSRVLLFLMSSPLPSHDQDAFQMFDWMLVAEAHGSKPHLDTLVRATNAGHYPLERMNDRAKWMNLIRQLEQAGLLAKMYPNGTPDWHGTARPVKREQDPTVPVAVPTACGERAPAPASASSSSVRRIAAAAAGAAIDDATMADGSSVEVDPTVCDVKD